jgi:hypothetical protein
MLHAFGVGGAQTQKNMSHECLAVITLKNYDHILDQLRTTDSGDW